VPRCANKSCRHKLPKGAIPRVCNDFCRDAAIGQAIAKVKAAKDRAAARAKNLVEREAKEQRKQFRRKKQEFVANDYSKQFALTKKEAQKLANRLDQRLPCICCSKPRGDVQFCGGHFKTAGAHPELALDLRNIHGQRNHHCNQQKSGNIEGDKNSHGYKRGLVARYGQWIVDYLESYQPTRKRTCDELIAMRKEFAAEIRRLEKGEAPSKDWRALPQEAGLGLRGSNQQGTKAA
jgi:hypothetical protein